MHVTVKHPHMPRVRVVVGDDQLGNVVLIEAVAQAPRTFRARSRGMHRAGEHHGVAKSQVSSLYRVRVSGEYLHRERPGPWPGRSCFSVFLSPLRKSRDPHPARAA